MKLILKRVTREPKSRKLKYLVTGTGRCGTIYVAVALSSVGLPCGHEAIFTFGGIETALKKLAGSYLDHSVAAQLAGFWLKNSQHIVAEASFMAVPFLNHPCLSETEIIHIVRHPLKVIASFVNAFDYFQEIDPPDEDPHQKFIYSHLKELPKHPDSLSRACFYYQRWNEMIEEKSTIFHRVEDPIESLLDKLGVSSAKVYENRLANTQAHKSPSVVVSEKIRNQLGGMARQYGYLLEEPWYDFAAHAPENFVVSSISE